MEEKIYLRPANIGDAKLFFEWVNEAAVRKNSFNEEPVIWKTHLEWFQSTLQDKRSLIFVMMLGDGPIGQVRLSVKDNRWQISYSIDLEYRGQGYGKALLQLAENELARKGYSGDSLFAEVKADNIASQQVFIRLGYKETNPLHNDAYAYIKTI